MPIHTAKKRARAKKLLAGGGRATSKQKKKSKLKGSDHRLEPKHGSAHPRN